MWNMVFWKIWSALADPIKRSRKGIITSLKGNSFWWWPECPGTTGGRMSMNPREFLKQEPDPVRGQRNNGPSSIFHYIKTKVECLNHWNVLKLRGLRFSVGPGPKAGWEDGSIESGEKMQLIDLQRLPSVDHGKESIQQWNASVDADI